jgi:ankyrin repeat protein
MRLQNMFRHSCLVAVLAAGMPLLVAQAAAAQTSRDTRLADAAMKADRAAVLNLLKQNADVNGAHGDGMTALHWAAVKSDFEMAKALLAAGASVKAVTRVGAITPLFMAAQAANAEMIRAMLAAGADARAAKANGTTALMIAAAAGSADGVKALIAAGADVNARENQNRQTAAMFAAAENRNSVLELLAQHGADLDLTSKVIPLADKPRYDDDGNLIKPPTPEQMARTGRGPLSSMGGLTALHYAARQGHRAGVAALVKAGANVNRVSDSDRTSPMLIAVSNGHFDVARLLLDNGADPNLADESGLAPLYAAVDAEWAPLGWAPNPITAQEKITYLELMKALLEKGANPNARLAKKLWFRSLTHDQHWVTTAGATAFWRAAQSSDVPAMTVLVEGGADPKIPTIAGTTPLMAAAGVGWGANFHRNLPDHWVEAARYCLELGIDVNAVDRDNFTAMHGAAYRGDIEMMKLFAEHGAKLDVKSKFGYASDMANGPKVNAHLPIEQPEALALILQLGGPAPVMPKPTEVRVATPRR